MADTYRFKGYYPTVYPAYVRDGVTLTAIPGETTLDFDPGDSWWEKETPPSKRVPADES